MPEVCGMHCDVPSLLQDARVGQHVGVETSDTCESGKTSHLSFGISVRCTLLSRLLQRERQ